MYTVEVTTLCTIFQRYRLESPTVYSLMDLFAYSSF